MNWKVAQKISKFYSSAIHIEEGRYNFNTFDQLLI